MPKRKRSAEMQQSIDDIMRQAHRSTGAELQQLYKRLAKRADQRLVRLEKLAQEDDFDDVKKYAYNKAMKDLHAQFGENALRFNRSTKGLSRRKLQSLINDVAVFLSSQSSTKTGIVETYEQRAQKLNERIGGGSNFTWRDFAKMFEMADYQADKVKGGSSTMVRAFGAIFRMQDDKEAVEAAKEGTYVFAKDPVVNDLAMQLWEGME